MLGPVKLGTEKLQVNTILLAKIVALIFNNLMYKYDYYCTIENIIN